MLQIYNIQAYADLKNCFEFIILYGIIVYVNLHECVITATVYANPLKQYLDFVK